MIRFEIPIFALVATLLPLGAWALPPPASEVEHRLERILLQRSHPLPRGVDAEAGPAVAPLLTAESYEQLKEQILGLLPGDALEFVARSLVDRQLKVELSSKKAMVVFRLPLE